MPSLRISDIARALDARAPVATAEAWDNVGLLLGNPAAKVRAAVVAVDLTPEVLAAAERRKAGLIVTHHPCIFPKGKGPSRLLKGTPVHDAIRAGVAVYAAHTNFDRCALEVSDSIAAALRISLAGRLLDSPTESLMKLAVFVPDAALETVREAAFAAGAGHVGNYDACSFAAEGFGTFRGAAGTTPHIGRPGRFEQVREQKLEVVFPRGLEGAVVRAVRDAHPYEEVAYDLWRLDNPPAREGVIKGLGYGFFGDLAKPTPLKQLLPKISRAFATNGGTLTGGEGRITRVAFSPGKGSSFIRAALASAADLFITGEVGYHDAREAAAQGLRVLELGHTESEYFFPKVMGGWLKQLGLSVLEHSQRVQEKRFR